MAENDKPDTKDQDQVTSESVPPSVQDKKHPLEHPWTLWFDNPSARQKGNWGSSLRKVYTFSTVEEFWCLYNNIATPSRLISGADFHCFKEGIEPKWEDPKCQGGGKWTINTRKDRIDTLWLHTLLAMIGEQFDQGEQVCGAVASVRGKADRVAIWTRLASNEDLQVSLAKQWKKAVDVSDKIGYLTHEDAKKDDRKAKDRYFSE